MINRSTGNKGEVKRKTKNLIVNAKSNWANWIYSNMDKNCTLLRKITVLYALEFRVINAIPKINRQPNDIKSNREPSKRLIFNRQLSKGHPIETLFQLPWLLCLPFPQEILAPIIPGIYRSKPQGI